MNYPNLFRASVLMGLAARTASVVTPPLLLSLVETELSQSEAQAQICSECLGYCSQYIGPVEVTVYENGLPCYSYYAEYYLSNDCNSFDSYVYKGTYCYYEP